MDVSIIPGGCTSKVQPLDVCLNKPFKGVLRQRWIQYIDAQVASASASPEAPPNKLKTAPKETICDWIKDGLDYLKDHNDNVKKSFLVCGITNSLNGSENHFIRCAKELPTMQLPYVDESADDLFKSDCDSDGCESGDDSVISLLTLHEPDTREN